MLIQLQHILALFLLQMSVLSYTLGIFQYKFVAVALMENWMMQVFQWLPDVLLIAR